MSPGEGYAPLVRDCLKLHLCSFTLEWPEIASSNAEENRVRIFLNLYQSRLESLVSQDAPQTIKISAPGSSSAQVTRRRMTMLLVRKSSSTMVDPWHYKVIPYTGALWQVSLKSALAIATSVKSLGKAILSTIAWTSLIIYKTPF